jgi:hypothetical protein
MRCIAITASAEGESRKAVANAQIIGALSITNDWIQPGVDPSTIGWARVKDVEVHLLEMPTPKGFVGEITYCGPIDDYPACFDLRLCISTRTFDSLLAVNREEFDVNIEIQYADEHLDNLYADGMDFLIWDSSQRKNMGISSFVITINPKGHAQA